MYLFRLCWVTAAACGLSLTAVHGLLLAVAPVLQSMSSGECCSAAVTRRFSGCSSQALEHGLSSYGTWALLSCSMGDPPGRDRTGVPCIGRQILNHWITREA